MSTGLIILLVVLVLAALFLIGYYNSFISKRNMVEQSFSTIDVMLKKRSDLIPNLVATVKQYMEHEQNTLTKIAQYRSRIADSKLDANERVSANNEMNKLLGNIMIQVERYPNLKADGQFKDLSSALQNLEEQLSAARRAYNATVTHYNTSVEMFPANIFAGLFHFKRKAVLETPPEERKNPNVGALFRS